MGLPLDRITAKHPRKIIVGAKTFGFNWEINVTKRHPPAYNN